jgi:hypothetical protein
MIIPRRNIFSSIVLVSLIFFSGQAVARDLTWSDVVAEAKAKNPALVKAKESLDQARWALTRSYSNFLPKLSASAGTGQSQVNADGVVKDFYQAAIAKRHLRYAAQERLGLDDNRRDARLPRV